MNKIGEFFALKGVHGALRQAVLEEGRHIKVPAAVIIGMVAGGLVQYGGQCGSPVPTEEEATREAEHGMEELVRLGYACKEEEHVPPLVWLTEPL